MKYTQEDLQDALDLAKPGRILELDSDGNMSKNCVAAVIHNLCALAEYYRLAKSQEARWYKEFTDETSKHSAAIKRAEMQRVLDDFTTALEMPEIRENFDREWAWFMKIRRKDAYAKRQLI